MFGFRIPDADQAMLISGKKGQVNAPFEVVLGHRKFAPLFLYKVDFMTLRQQQHQIQEDCFTKEKIPVRIAATIAFKVPADTKAIIDAGQRFLADQKLMPTAVGNITAGALRGIVGEMTLEDIISNRTELQTKVFQHAKDELGPQGLQIDTLNVFDIQDLSPGASAIEALSTPHLAEIRRDAAIAQANAAAQAAKAQQLATQQQADYERETRVTKAGYDAEVAQANANSQSTAEVAQQKAQADIAEANAERDRRQRIAQAKADAEAGKASAEASQAGPLAQATAQHDVAVAATSLAEQQSLQRVQELQRDVIAPAEADAKRRIAEAEAEAKATTLAATALASSNRVQVDMELVKQLPAVAQAIASELNGANLTVLNGAEGLTEIVTGAVAQAKTIYETMKTVRAATPTSPITNTNDTGTLEPAGSR